MIFICMGDSHFREDTPRCRKDENWMATQEEQFSQVVVIANKHNCPIIHTGDLFNRSVVPESVKNLFFRVCRNLSKSISVLPGNHDLMYHSMENIDKSSIGVLATVAELESSKIIPISFYAKECSWQNFGEEITNPGKKILFMHKLVFKLPSDMPPNVNAITAQELLEENPGYTWIFTGDNHQSFHYEKNGRHVVNPGHLNIQKSDELTPPIVYYVDTELGIVEEIEIKDDMELITDKYTKEEADREDRIEAFVEKIKSSEKVSLSFSDNVEEALLENEELTPDVIKWVRKLMEVKK